jgi:hypothetical protein
MAMASHSRRIVSIFLAGSEALVRFSLLEGEGHTAMWGTVLYRAGD